MLANFYFSLIFEGVQMSEVGYSPTQILEQHIIELIAGGATEKAF